VRPKIVLKSLSDLETIDYVSRKTAGQPDGPLVFTFHGTGGTENQFHRFAEETLPSATIISPRGDVDDAGKLRFFKRHAEGVYDMQDLAQRTEAMATFLADMKARHPAARTLGLGYSNGANILASVALKYPDIFDGFVLMHPLVTWQLAAHPALAGRRALVTAGHKDTLCPAPQTHALISFLSSQNIDVEEFWHGGGHEIQDTELAAVRAFLQRA